MFINLASNFPIMKSRPIEKCATAVWRFSVLMPLLFLAAGCHRDEVKVYRVAKDQDQPPQPTAPALPTDSPNPVVAAGTSRHLVHTCGLTACGFGIRPAAADLGKTGRLDRGSAQ